MARIVIEVPNQYADELGYQSMVTNPDFISTIDEATGQITRIGEPTIPNSETKANFLKRIVPKILADKLADKAVRALEKSKQDEIRTESIALRAAIETALTTE